MGYALKDKDILSSCFGDFVKFRIYMRFEENEIEFAMLQRSLGVFYSNCSMTTSSDFSNVAWRTRTAMLMGKMEVIVP